MSKRPNRAIRVVFQRGNDYGLFWQATLQGADLYGGTPERGGNMLLRVSYHESGAIHTYYQYEELDKQRVLHAPSQSLRELNGVEKVGGWGIPGHAVWGDKPKADTPTRKTLILGEPLPFPLSVDLWIAEHGRTDELVASAQMPNTIRVVSTLHLAATSSELLAVCVDDV